VLEQRGRDIARVIEAMSMTPTEARAIAKLAQSFEPFA
jgi:hypothetical protein